MLQLRFARSWIVAGGLILSVVLFMALTPWFTASVPSVTQIDKWMHGLVFAFLAIWFTGQYARTAYAGIATGLAAYGALIEIGQALLPYRTAEWADLAADCLGILAGILIALALTGGWSQRAEAWLGNRIG